MKHSRRLVELVDAFIYGKFIGAPTTATNVEVPPSGLTDLTLNGRKCEHGIYIPANSEDPDRALYCTLCYPYEIFTKKHAVFTA